MIGTAIALAAGGSALSSVLGARGAGKALRGGVADAQAFGAEAKRYSTKTFAPYVRAGNNAINQLDNIYTNNELDTGEVFRNTPQYQFLRDEGIRGLQASQSATGRLNSGASQRDITSFAEGLASTAYDSYINRLAQIAGVGLQASSNDVSVQAGMSGMQAGASLQGGQGQAQITSDLYTNLGNTFNAAAGNYATYDLLKNGSSKYAGNALAVN